MGMVILFLPIINIISFTIRFFEKGKSRGLDTSEEDVLALVSLSRKTGVLKHFEEKYINNVLELDKKTGYAGDDTSYCNVFSSC